MALAYQLQQQVDKIEAATSEKFVSNSKGESPPTKFEKSDSLTLPTQDDLAGERSTSQNDDYSLRFNNGKESKASSPEVSPRLSTRQRKKSFQDDRENHFDINQSGRPSIHQSQKEGNDYDIEDRRSI